MMNASKMMIAILVLVILQSTLAFASDPTTYTIDELYYYRQKHYQLVDVESDEVLLQKLKFASVKLIKVLLGYDSVNDMNFEKLIPDKEKVRPLTFEYFESIQPDKNIRYKPIRLDQLNEYELNQLNAQITNVFSTIQGRENPVKRTEFLNMLLQVIDEEGSAGIHPQLGTPHVWSEEFLKNHPLSPFTFATKLFYSLAYGQTDHHLKTDHENELIDWILAQSIASVTLPEMFRQSYRFNDGDLYLTLLTIENVLARYWRYEKREDLPVTQRLSSFASGYQYSYDRFGNWYHLFGIMLYGYIEGENKAYAVGEIENLGAKILDGFQFERIQKSWINETGGLIGADLRRAIEGGAHLTHQSNPKFLEAGYYLNLKEDFRDRLAFAPSPDFKADLSMDQVDILSKNRSLSHCDVDLLYIYDSELLNRATFKNRDFKAGEVTTLVAVTGDATRVRVFIRGCQGLDDEIVFEGR